MNFVNNKKSLIVISLIIFILLVPSIFAVGLAPAYKTVVLNGETISYDIRIMNEGGVAQSFELSVTGDLSEYIVLSSAKVDFSQGQTQRDIRVTIYVSKNVELKPGEYVARVLLKEQSHTGTGLMAVVGVASRIEMIVPGDGALLKSTLFAPNFKKDTTNAFSVEVKNYGGKDANNCKAIIEISTSLNVNVDSLVSSTSNILPGATEKFLVSWSPSVGSGNYLAKSTVLCDNAEIGDERLFSIGSPELRIISFDSDNFKLGGISKFDLIVASDWSEEIKGASAGVKILKDGKEIYSSRTENKNIMSRSKVIFPVFIDSSSMSPGEYMTIVSLYYLDGELEQVYSSYFGTDDFIFESLSGMVVGGKTKGSSSSDVDGDSNNALLILVIIFILVVNVVLVFRLIKKKK